MSASPSRFPTPQTDLIANVFDAMPLPAFVVDHDCNIIEFNLAGAKLLDRVPFAVLRLGGGRQLQCIHSAEDAGGITAQACQECMVKNFVRDVFSKVESHRNTGRVRLTGERSIVDMDFLVTVAPIFDESEPLALLILDDAAELTALLAAKTTADPVSSSPGSKARAKAPAHKTDNS